MANKRKSKASGFNSQAAAEALIRFNPELSGLKQLQADAVSTAQQRIHAGRGTSAALQSVIDAAVPDVRQGYSDAAQGIGTADSLVKGDMAGLAGAGADRFRNALTDETTNFANILRGAQANALAGLSQRKVAAAEGAKFSADQAGSDLAATLDKLGARKSELLKESGAFTTQRIAELAQEQKKQDFTATQNALGRQNSRTVAGVRADGSVIPGGKADKPGKEGPKTTPTGAKVRSTAEHAAFLDRLGKVTAIAAPLVKQAKAEGHSSGFVRRLLVNGVQGGTLHDKLGKPQVNPDTGLTDVAPSIKAQDPFLVSVAVDVAYDGHVSRKNQKALWRRGLSLKSLGLPTRAPATPSAGKLASDAAGTVQALFGGG